ncbi:MAG: hypothetical protein SLAVMIC_00477 [uncultured marine phage]|uniref:Uncharacterized protein n=1 Tax=uncultured marine phage TaxID=707152 RepID=A0A8D9FQT6_9VIRU|nr:MAG: hypothetical protein SLAVMIC_00477 [uncultured marine phage]
MINKNEMYIKVEDGDDNFVHIRAFLKEDNSQIFDHKILSLHLGSNEFEISHHDEHKDDGVFHHDGGVMTVYAVERMYEEEGYEVR